LPAVHIGIVKRCEPVHGPGSDAAGRIGLKGLRERIAWHVANLDAGRSITALPPQGGKPAKAKSISPFSGIFGF
jgi:hypothetical protein